ncbi:MAG: hypothetical protein B6D77_01460 [gamma proteobacterium symbiont of Ctena orbiculata]|nr:MAG: hypothetical protein B6D77_01460 [gamma proteobacterium symbiont of Ctena orbiculata]PVV21007.1 MAG: hypothetical protein B6D78_08850 [gamma proteobacterium symbiont of Ctena orbiculata]
MRLWHITTICLALICLSNSQAEINPEHRSNRQLAVTVCNDYRETNRLPCFVSRKECPRGFEVIERFSDSTGPSFSACRDKRHERPARLARSSNNLFNAKNQQLVEQFDRLISIVEKHRTGAASRLPKASRDKLALFFSGIDLNSIELAHSKALMNGCLTDCRQIFCADKDQVDAWTNPQTPVLSLKLLHQLAHAERCEIKGGRDRFIQTWLRHLPDETLAALERGDPLDTQKIHFAMFMQSNASNRAESICRRVGCLRD